MRKWAVALVVSLAAVSTAHGQAIERSMPDVGTEAEAEVGQPVMMLERVYRAPAIRLETAVTSLPFHALRIQLPAGLYALTKTTGKGRLFESRVGVTLTYKDKSRFVPAGGILLPSDGGPPQAYAGDNGNADIKAGIPDAVVKEVGIEDVGTDGFRIQLLYGGVSKGTVTLSYREFMRDTARPAFTQELAYDLAEGDEIGFRGARLKVLKANNVSIRYVVVKPLAAPH